MSKATAINAPFLDKLPPTEDELPYDDGVPMESNRHRLQMTLLIEALEVAWQDRDDYFVGGNMFVYFSPDQVMEYDYRGPDFFVVQDVPRRDRKNWVVWQEGKGPDVIIELISESTASLDKQEKKQIYQNRLRVPEYYWYDPFTNEWAGFALQKGVYKPIKQNTHGRLVSHQLQLTLTRWQGTYTGVEATWLRWATIEGDLLPTGNELAEQERQRANELAQLLARYQEKFGDLPD